MAKQKPYLDGAATRSKMLQNIESLLDEEAMPVPLEQKCCALLSFYRNPPPPGHQYSWNHLWVMSTEFNKAYLRMQALLWGEIESAKQKATRLRRRLEAAELAIELWEKGHNFDEESGYVRIVPVPAPKPPPTPDQLALRKASINATWRNGSRNS
jgi:hypothetical protein